MILTVIERGMYRSSCSISVHIHKNRNVIINQNIYIYIYTYMYICSNICKHCNVAMSTYAGHTVQCVYKYIYIHIL